MLAVSGQLDRSTGGSSSELNGGHRRRTLYGYISRHRLDDLLRLFDFPDPNITAGERSVTTVPLQQLFVLNSEFMVSQAKSLAARLNKEEPTDIGQIDRCFVSIVEPSCGLHGKCSGKREPGFAGSAVQQCRTREASADLPT